VPVLDMGSMMDRASPSLGNMSRKAPGFSRGVTYCVGRSAIHGECGTGRRADQRSAFLMGLPGRQRSRSIHVRADAQIGSGTTDPDYFCGPLARQQLGTDLHHQWSNRPEL